ncbi:phage/plasmid primase, P4 family [Streptomyces sp. NPDC060334]|uniref:DNA primase family protein n=1 Tax=unclassified Streptomyces TaxID=2593676 RepID=UPI0006B00E08|nr:MULTISPECIES: phage/plasmid primase, P4 family [unclassified Streptomyces]KOU37863.1 DNA primase [Streptomyces sp. WM4235]MCX5078342.1 phage/plasmid primase, P4 family [Streptomyces sp. NBC_00424]
MSSAGSTGFNAQAAAEQLAAFTTDTATPGRRLPAQQSGAPGAGADFIQAGLLHNLTDRGNAKLFAYLHHNRFRHVEGLGWYVWDEYRWKRTGGEKAAIWAAGDMAEDLPAHDPRGVFTDRELAQHRKRTMSTSGVKAMLTQAKASPELALDPDTLDGDKYALCTPAGVVDLRTGDLHKPNPTRDLHSRATHLAPEAMPTPRFHTFLKQTFGDDDKGKEMIHFLHLLLGYSITGDVGGQVLPFLYGVGANGKSALLDVVIKILGDYADVAPPGFLMERGKFNEHSTELTELHGRRLFVCSELKPHDKFDEARVKLLTGGDRLKARRMRQDFFSFEPTHKLWLLGNHRPEVGTGGHAFWRRIRLIPFEKVVPDHRKIDNLAEALVQEEGPGILHWMIQGAKAYLAGKPPLTGPNVVRAATQAYATTEDHIGRFLLECCTTGAHLAEPRDLKVEQGALYRAYSAWCLDGEGLRPATTRAFATRIRAEAGVASPNEMLRSNGQKFYPGLALLADEEQVPRDAIRASTT